MDPLFAAVLTYVVVLLLRRTPLSSFPKETLGMLLSAPRSTFFMQGTVQAAPCVGCSVCASGCSAAFTCVADGKGVQGQAPSSLDRWWVYEKILFLPSYTKDHSATGNVCC